MPRRKQKSFKAKLAHLFIPQRSNNHRSQILHPESLLILVAVVIGFFSLLQTVRFFPSLHNSVLGFSSSITAIQVIEQTNQERAKLGLKPLVINQQLSAAALAKAQDMLNDQYWAHTSPEGRQPWDFMKAANYSYRVAGENLARDFHGTTEMISAWMASPMHKANIVNEKYEQLGIAVVDGRLEGFDTVLVVQMFGSPAQKTVSLSDASGTSESQVTSVESAPMHNPVQAIGDGGDHTSAVTPEANIFNGSTQTKSVLASALVPIGQLRQSPLFTPLQLTKILFLGVILMIIFTLSYDSFVIGNRRTMRLVGSNLGHIILFTCVAFLMILFKGGMIK
jgi:cysteine-rich secretory family protein